MPLKSIRNKFGSLCLLHLLEISLFYSPSPSNLLHFVTFIFCLVRFAFVTAHFSNTTHKFNVRWDCEFNGIVHNFQHDFEFFWMFFVCLFWIIIQLLNEHVYLVFFNTFFRSLASGNKPACSHRFVFARWGLPSCYSELLGCYGIARLVRSYPLTNGCG